MLWRLTLGRDVREPVRQLGDDELHSLTRILQRSAPRKYRLRRNFPQEIPNKKHYVLLAAEQEHS